MCQLPSHARKTCKLGYADAFCGAIAWAAGHLARGTCCEGAEAGALAALHTGAKSRKDAARVCAPGRCNHYGEHSASETLTWAWYETAHRHRMTVTNSSAMNGHREAFRLRVHTHCYSYWPAGDVAPLRLASQSLLHSGWLAKVNDGQTSWKFLKTVERRPPGCTVPYFIRTTKHTCTPCIIDLANT